MILMSQILNEGALEKAAEDFLRQSIKGTEWEGKIFIAGGYVRDELMGKDPKDLDIMVEAPNGGIEFANWITKKVGSYSEGTNPVTFPRFGTAKFNLRGITHNGIDLSGMDIEAVMPRQEAYVPGSRKPEVQFTNLKGDAERRDLTINAMYKNLSTGEYIDPTGMGMPDLKAGVLRTPLDPSKTFTDDPLRMLRVVRFFAKYGWKFTPGLIKSLKANASQLENISKERIMEELNKMLITTRPEKAMKLLKLTGLMDYIVPEFRDAYNMTQNKHHKHTVWQHTLHVLRNTKPELLNRLMALFHDIGKIVTRKITPKGIQFIGHEKEGAEMAVRIMQNLKYPLEISKAVGLGVASHMKLKHGGDDAIELSDKSLRKFQRDVGKYLENVLDVIHADNISHSEESSMPNQIEIVKRRLDQLNAQAPQRKGPPIDGFRIQKEFGVKPGPIIGKILGALVDKMDENPNLSEEEALHIAHSIINSDKSVEIDEGVRLDHLNREIDRLEKEWDRLDSQGGRELQQLSIMRKLEKLRSEKLRWEKLHQSVDTAPEIPIVEDILQEIKVHNLSKPNDDTIYFFAYRDSVFLLSDSSDLNPLVDKIKDHPALVSYDFTRTGDVYEFITDTSEMSPDFISGTYEPRSKELVLYNHQDHVNPKSSLLVKKVANQLRIKHVSIFYYDPIKHDDITRDLKRKDLTGGVPHVVFHGTTSSELRDLLKYGLYPDIAQSKNRFSGRDVYHEDTVFFTSTFDVATFYAQNAVRESESGFPIVIQLSVPDPSKLTPDYDAARTTKDPSPYAPGKSEPISQQTGIQVSRETGKWGYQGRIPSKFFQWIYYYSFLARKWRKAKPSTFLDLLNRYGSDEELSYLIGTYDLSESIIKTSHGTPIKRYRNLVGKQVGSQLYVHKNYASKVIPVNILQKASTILRKLYPHFKFNAIMLDAKTGTVRFDEAPDFDTAREPHVGRYISVDSNGNVREGQSSNIWHHKWMWVMDDYDGFDVEESKNWSRLWLSKVPEVAKGTEQSFHQQLIRYGLNV